MARRIVVQRMVRMTCNQSWLDRETFFFWVRLDRETSSENRRMALGHSFSPKKKKMKKKKKQFEVYKK